MQFYCDVRGRILTKLVLIDLGINNFVSNHKIKPIDWPKIAWSPKIFRVGTPYQFLKSQNKLKVEAETNSEALDL